MLIIRAGTADQHVVSAAAVQDVVAAAAVERVRASERAQVVVARPATEPVDCRAAGQRVAEVAARDVLDIALDVVTTRAVVVADTTIERSGADGHVKHLVAARIRRGVRAAATVEVVRSRAAVQHVGVGRPVENVVARAADDRVGRIAARQHVVGAAADDLNVAAHVVADGARLIGAVTVVERRTVGGHIHSRCARRVADGVHRGAAVQIIGARAAVERIGPRPPVEDVVAGAAAQDVGHRAAADVVVARATDDVLDVGQDVVAQRAAVAVAVAGIAVVGRTIEHNRQRRRTVGVRDRVAAAAALHHVRAGAAVDRVSGRTARDAVASAPPTATTPPWCC